MTVCGEIMQTLKNKAFCKKWIDNEPEPCPIRRYKKCLDTNKPCEKAELVIFYKDVSALLTQLCEDNDELAAALKIVIKEQMKLMQN